MTFEDLLDKLPPGADEIDRLDALKATQAGYERMLWDHVRGNPALALEAFRTSLVKDESGLVHVRALQVPDAARLDALPDSTLFVFVAVLQLAPASVADVARATGQTQNQVLGAFRFGRAQGYFSLQRGERVEITWPWLHLVTQLLQRRNLLVKP